MKGRLLGLIACTVLSGVSQAGATVYDLVGTSGLSVSGTITTDGGTGVLAASDITDWHINQTFDTVHFESSIDPANSTVTLTGTALTATSTHLLFDFSDTAPSNLYFSSNNFFGGSGGLSLQFCDAAAPCTNQNLVSTFSEIEVVVIAPGLGSTSNALPESGVTEIAAAAVGTVPEPSGWAMMLIGFAGVGFVGYRRAKSGRAMLAA